MKRLILFSFLLSLSLCRAPTSSRTFQIPSEYLTMSERITDLTQTMSRMEKEHLFPGILDDKGVLLMRGLMWTGNLKTQEVPFLGPITLMLIHDYSIRQSYPKLYPQDSEGFLAIAKAAKTLATLLKLPDAKLAETDRFTLELVTRDAQSGKLPHIAYHDGLIAISEYLRALDCADHEQRYVRTFFGKLPRANPCHEKSWRKTRAYLSNTIEEGYSLKTWIVPEISILQINDFIGRQFYANFEFAGVSLIPDNDFDGFTAGRAFFYAHDFFHALSKFNFLTELMLFRHREADSKEHAPKYHQTGDMMIKDFIETRQQFFASTEAFAGIVQNAMADIEPSWQKTHRLFSDALKFYLLHEDFPDADDCQSYRQYNVKQNGIALLERSQDLANTIYSHAAIHTKPPLVPYLVALKIDGVEVIRTSAAQVLRQFGRAKDIDSWLDSMTFEKMFATIIDATNGRGIDDLESVTQFREHILEYLVNLKEFREELKINQDILTRMAHLVKKAKKAPTIKEAYGDFIKSICHRSLN